MPDVLFTVDPEDLDSLRARLDHIRAGIRDIRKVAESCDPLDLGPDRAVWAALQEFDAEWSSGVDRIGQNVTALEDLLSKAAADYRSTDQQVAQAATRSGPPAS
jgi:hypothetical protein